MQDSLESFLGGSAAASVIFDHVDHMLCHGQLGEYLKSRGKLCVCDWLWGMSCFKLLLACVEVKGKIYIESNYIFVYTGKYCQFNHDIVNLLKYC